MGRGHRAKIHIKSWNRGIKSTFFQETPHPPHIERWYNPNLSNSNYKYINKNFVYILILLLPCIVIDYSIFSIVSLSYFFDNIYINLSCGILLYALLKSIKVIGYFLLFGYLSILFPESKIEIVLLIWVGDFFSLNRVVAHIMMVQYKLNNNYKN